nr:hypothetical protein CFP56_11922 [Quercus suber]
MRDIGEKTTAWPNSMRKLDRLLGRRRSNSVGSVRVARPPDHPLLYCASIPFCNPPPRQLALRYDVARVGSAASPYLTDMENFSATKCNDMHRRRSSGRGECVGLPRCLPTLGFPSCPVQRRRSMHVGNVACPIEDQSRIGLDDGLVGHARPELSFLCVPKSRRKGFLRVVHTVV